MSRASKPVLLHGAFGSTIAFLQSFNPFYESKAGHERYVTAHPRHNAINVGNEQLRLIALATSGEQGAVGAPCRAQRSAVVALEATFLIDKR
jgi:hypothetical protein